MVYRKIGTRFTWEGKIVGEDFLDSHEYDVLVWSSGCRYNLGGGYARLRGTNYPVFARTNRLGHAGYSHPLSRAKNRPCLGLLCRATATDL